MSSDAPLLHLSFERKPLLAPGQNSPHVLVIGGGIIGLSTAWTLLDSGFKVTVLAQQFASRDGNTPRLTSQIAGALYVVLAVSALGQAAHDLPAGNIRLLCVGIPRT